jgi:hypothetical protein
MRYFTTLVFLGFLTLTVGAQEKPAGLRPTFRSSFAVALINGSASTSYNVQTVHGIILNKSFVGLGVGIDYYKLRTLPLFLELRQEFGKGRKHFLVYGDGGRSIDWLTEKSKEFFRWQSAVNYKGGWYYDVGVGYRIHLKENALILTTGYSYKEVKRDESYDNCIFGGQCINESETFLYKMSRISVRAAFQF